MHADMALHISPAPLHGAIIRRKICSWCDGLFFVRATSSDETI